MGIKAFTSNGSSSSAIIQYRELSKSFSSWQGSQDFIIHDDFKLALGWYEQMVSRLVFSHDKLSDLNFPAIHRLHELTNLNAIQVLEEVVI